jgi:hypothetical protein
MKNLLLAGVALLTVTACSKSENDAPRQESKSFEVTEGRTGTTPMAADDAAAESTGQTPPDIGQSVAPGVAFNFTYAFSLPEAKIAETQEAHAALCSKLGIARCRVTGIIFNKERDGNIEAHLSFKIDPALALSFGRDATALVERADGNLETSSVSGEDVGSQIVESDKNAAQLKADLARIDVQLKIPKLSSQVRQQLLGEARELKARLAGLKSTRDDQVESLATTPMIFNYEPSEAVLGFDRGSPMQTGLSAGASSLKAISTLLAVLLGAVGPWALAIGLGVLGWRTFRKVKGAAEAE